MRLVYKDSAAVQPIKITQNILQITCYPFLNCRCSEINALLFRYYSRCMPLMLKVEFCSLGFEGGVPNVESQCIGELNCEGQKLRRLHLLGGISQVMYLSLLLRGFPLF